MRFNTSHLIALVAIGAIPSSARSLDRSSTGLVARDFVAPELANVEASVIAKRAPAGAIYPLAPPPGKTTKDLAKAHREKNKPSYQKDTVSSKQKKQEKSKPSTSSRPRWKGSKRSIDEASVIAKRAREGAIYPLAPPPGKTTKDLAKAYHEKNKPSYQKDTESSKQKKQKAKPSTSSRPPSRPRWKGSKRSIDEAADEETFASS